MEAGADAYVVNFRYGRRGASLKEGTKTVFPVSHTEAEKIFLDLETEKRKKGYAAEGENPGFIAGLQPTGSGKTGRKKHNVILSLLKSALAGDEHESWPLSRIIWRAGELEMTEAVPLIIKLADKNDHLQLYSCIRSLGRLGDAKAVPFLQGILKEQYPSHIINLAHAALLNVCDDDTRSKHIISLTAALPESMKQAMNAGNAYFDAYCSDLFTTFGSGSCDFLVPFYLVSTADERLRKAFLLAIPEVPVKAGYFKFVRQIFKIAEMLNDTVVYGLLTKVIEKAPSTFNGTGVYINRKWVSATEELKKENSTLAFSKKTKDYFGRRIVRTLTKLGNNKSPLYTTYATDILLAFDDRKDLSPPERTFRVRYMYNSVERTYTRIEINTWFDSYAQHKALYFILYANSTRYRLPLKAGRWQCVEPYTPGQLFQPLREEAFAALWNQAPEDVIRLLAYSNCGRVSGFALFVFQNNAAFREQVKEEELLAFIKNNSVNTQALGFELVKERYTAAAPPTVLIIALLLSNVAEARAYAMALIDKDPLRFANDPELMLIILVSADLASHTWLGAFLLRNKADVSSLLAALNNLLDEIRSHAFVPNEEHIVSIAAVIESVFKEAVSALDPAVILALLTHPDAIIRGFAGKLLTLRNVDPALVPDTIIFSLLESENKMARRAAIDLLDQLQVNDLAAKQSLVLSLCLSPLQDVRQSAQKLVDKLLLADPDAGYGLVHLFIPVLTVKEKYEGLHEDIFQLISAKLSGYLDKIAAKQILSLCASRYLASQELGNVLLGKNIQPGSLSIKEYNQLANSSLLKNRRYVLEYYSSAIGRIREEKKEAVMLSDSSWDDVRLFAFNYFRTNFSEQDWAPELFIALCDSTKEDVQAFGREMITKWFEKDEGFDYLLRLSQHPDSRMQLFASGFLDQYAKNNFEMLQKLGDFFITLLSNINKGRTAKIRAIGLLSGEAVANEQNAWLISAIFNRMSATAAIQDKALYIKALLEISKAFPSVEVLLSVKETPVYKVKQKPHAV